VDSIVEDQRSMNAKRLGKPRWFVVEDVMGATTCDGLETLAATPFNGFTT
jgi:hypothetical protein